MMLRGMLLLFVVVPLLELYLLTLIAQATSFWFAVALTVVTGVVGGTLAKREGLKVWRRWQHSLAEMQVPEEGVISGLLVLLGGVLLLTPGVLTDAAGFVLLIPITRRSVAAAIRRRIDTRFGFGEGVFTRLSQQGPGNFGGIHARGSREAIDTSGTALGPEDPREH